MKTSELEGAELDYWVARGLHDFIREIHFTDGGQTLAIRGNDRGRAWDGRFLPSTSWEFLWRQESWLPLSKVRNPLKYLRPASRVFAMLR